MEKTQKISTAGGRIVCNRCQASSKGTKLQCGRPAMRRKSVCQFHGGKSTGPKTPEGKERSRQANLKSGEYTQESMLQRNHTLLGLAYLEEVAHLLSMTSGSKTRGPKPRGYAKLSSLADLLKQIEQD